MQPLALNGPAALAQTPRTRPHRRRKKDTLTITIQSTPKQKSHPASLHPHIHKHRHFQKYPPQVLTADARTEHLLLAAKRIGRQRTGILAGLTETLDRRQDESTSTVVATPKTPKRTAADPPGSRFIYFNSPTRPGAMLVPAYPLHLLQTPSSSKTAASVSSVQQQKSNQGSRTQNPPTLLDSLLSAARSMIANDEDEEETLNGARRSRSSEVPDSPVQKCRKLVARDKALDKQSSTSV